MARKGRATTGSSGSAGLNNDPRQPGTVHDAVRYITPYLWLNYQSMGTPSTPSVMQVDAISIEALKTGVVDATNLVSGLVTAGSVAAEKITADKLDADAINGRVITGNTLQTAADGQRVVISPGGGTPDVGSVKFYSGSTNEAAPAALNTAIAYSSDASGTYELPSLNLTAPRVNGTRQESGLFTRGHIPGYSVGLFTLYANQLGGNGVAHITGYGADTATQGSSIELYVRDAPSGSVAGSAKLASDGFTVDGTLKAGNIATSRVIITPRAANTPTSVTVTGLNLKGTAFRAVATPSTTAPETAVTGVGVTNVTATGLTIWLTRTNTTSTAVDWIVIGS